MGPGLTGAWGPSPVQMGQLWGSRGPPSPGEQGTLPWFTVSSLTPETEPEKGGQLLRRRSLVNGSKRT